MTTTKQKSFKRVCVRAGCCAGTVRRNGERAEAQEIQLTGPLAGAPAVRKLRLHRQGPLRDRSGGFSFTLLDEYQRTILLGARLQYNFTDWLSFGVWGALGSVIKHPHVPDRSDSRA